MPKASNKPRSQVPTSIGFRLDAQSLQVLTTRAAQLDVSAHELARHYVIEALYGAQIHRELPELLQALRQEIAANRGDLAAATRVILQATKNVRDKEAVEWVTNNLNQPCSQSPTQ
jgi:hypothetical protein